MRRRTGFTLIEVMIALFLFGVGMLTLLRAITYFLSMGKEVRQQAQAVALAKEGIDILYNQKDTNLRRGVQRDCAVIDIKQTLNACGLLFKANSSYRVGFNGNTGYTIIETTTGAQENALYQHTGYGVTYISHDPVDGVPTEFKRYVTLEQGSLQGQPLAADHVLKATVVVQYKADDPSRKVVLQTYLTAGGRGE